MEEDEPTGASQHKAEETEEGQDAETLFKNAAKKETECFPRVDGRKPIISNIV